MGLKGKRREQLLRPGERIVVVALEGPLTEAVDFSGETQPLPTLGPSSHLLLNPPINQTQPRASGQEGLGIQSLEVILSRTEKDREKNR